MRRLIDILEKTDRLAIGLMSGTSVDGIDSALIKIHGSGPDTKVELLAFENYKYDIEVRERIFKLFDAKTSTVDVICHMNFLLGELFAQAALNLITKSGYSPQEIDFIASHGQTIYHAPQPVNDKGYVIRSTLQIGEPAVIAERTGIITIADFRVRDVAAGGQGAPLVVYSEYLLYREKDKTIVLQNIGGISNATVLPANCDISDVFAFDNGPGNMVIDEVIRRITGGKMFYDNDGQIAQHGKISEELLTCLMTDPYFTLPLPKTTGRERFGRQYVDKLINQAEQLKVHGADLAATVTAFVAKAIADSYERYIINEYKVDKIIISGGGSYNKALIKLLRNYINDVRVLTQEDIGFNSDAKEAIAFAVLGNETINGNANNVPSATGAKKPVIMGKIC